MKIRWLNEALTEAVITRGALWWKRAALVQLVTQKVQPRYSGDADFRSFWKYVVSGQEIGGELANDLQRDAQLERLRRAERQDWQPAGKLPKARLVER